MDLTESDLDLAAHLGDMDAMRALGRSVVDPGGLAEWAWGFSRFGWEIMVRVTFSAAHKALPVWDQYRPSDAADASILGGPLIGQSLTAVKRGLECGTRPETEVKDMLNSVRELVARASCYVDEASGSPDIVLAREQALSAAVAALEVLETFAWTDAEARRNIADTSDRAELEARRKAGPALHVVQAFRHVCVACAIDGNQLRDALRASSLLKRK